MNVLADPCIEYSPSANSFEVEDLGRMTDLKGVKGVTQGQFHRNAIARALEPGLANASRNRTVFRKM